MNTPSYRSRHRSRPARVDYKPRSLRVEPLEQRCMLSAGHGGDLPTIAEGDSQVVIGPHHADPGHEGTPAHFFAETGDAHHFAWQDQDLSTPNVTDIYYDYRDLGGKWGANLITPGQIAMAELALEEWENASGGTIQFTRNTTAPDADIIVIGTGNLRAVGGFRSAPGGILGLGGGTYTHNSEHTIGSALAWMDFKENWDEVNANGDPDGGVDYFSVVAQEVGHALGLGHLDDLGGTNIMNGSYTGEVAEYSTHDDAHIQAVYGVGTSTPDTTAPVISDVVAINITGNSATISWTTDEAADSRVNFGTTAAYDSLADNTTLRISHSIILTGLTANTEYHFMVTSADSSGNSASSTDFTFTSTSAPTVGTVAIVESISYTMTGGKNNDKNLIVTVAIIDDLGLAVSGASVSSTLSNDSGGFWTGLGTTDDGGTLSLKLRNAPSGTYTTVITDVTADGLTWDGSSPTSEFTKSSQGVMRSVHRGLAAATTSILSSVDSSSDSLGVEFSPQLGGSEQLAGTQEDSSSDDVPARRRATARRAARPALSRAAVDASMRGMAEGRSVLRQRTATRRGLQAPVERPAELEELISAIA